MRLMIVDDHEIIRDGLLMILEQAYCIDHCEFAKEGLEATQIAEHFPADLVLLDLSMPGGLDGFAILDRLRKSLPKSKIVIFSMYDEVGYQKRAFELGADGFLCKQLEKEQLIGSLDKILANQKVFNRLTKNSQIECIEQLELPITEREKEVFKMTVQGYSQKDISTTLNISIKTVENYRFKIGKKLNTHKRYEWVDIARKYNIFAL